MNIKHALAVLAVAVAAPSWATTYPNGSLGSLSVNPSNFESGSIVPGSFADHFNFTLSALSDVLGSVSDNSHNPLWTLIGLTPGSVTFSTASLGAQQSVAIDNQGHFSFSGVAPGSYTLTISGLFNVPPPHGVASYTGSVYANAHTVPGTVPEPTALLMAFGGLAVMGFMLRRGGR